jgi:tetratricopeptide (TPR) repeat protein
MLTRNHALTVFSSCFLLTGCFSLSEYNPQIALPTPSAVPSAQASAPMVTTAPSAQKPVALGMTDLPGLILRMTDKLVLQTQDFLAPPLIGQIPGNPNLRFAAGSPETETQANFETGIQLYYQHRYPEAAKAFQTARSFDPRCAMCYWGEALVTEDGPAARDALRAAQRLAERDVMVNAKQRALIDALARRMSQAPQAEAEYTNAMQRLTARYRNDPNIQTLAVASYLEKAKPSATSSPSELANLQAIRDNLLNTLKQYPDHPGLKTYVSVLDNRLGVSVPTGQDAGAPAAGNVAASNPDRLPPLSMTAELGR